MLTTIEILALIFAVLVTLKILAILVNPKIWFNFVKKVWSRPVYTIIISVIFSAVILNFLLQTMSIVQIFAVMLFMIFILAIGFATYSKDWMKFAEKMLKDKKFLIKNWFYILIWIALLVWAFIKIFM